MDGVGTIVTTGAGVPPPTGAEGVDVLPTVGLTVDIGALDVTVGGDTVGANVFDCAGSALTISGVGDPVVVSGLPIGHKSLPGAPRRVK